MAGWQKNFVTFWWMNFQDINKLQYDIVKMLAAPDNNLFIVGDDDQSIYAFRGAKPEIMMHFPKDFPTVQTELLACNYRSTKQIVEAAGKVIGHNKRRFKKKIHTENQEGRKPLIKGFGTGREENCTLRTAFLKAREAALWKKIAVLPHQFRRRLPGGTSDGIWRFPFRWGDTLPNLYEHWISGNFISYMRLAMGERSRQEFLEVMNRPNRYISRNALEDSQVSFEALRWFCEDKEWMCDRIDKFEEDLKKLKNMTPYGAVNYIRHGVGYEEYLKGYAAYRKLKMEDLYEVMDELAESARGDKTDEDWFAHMAEYTRKLKEQAKTQISGKSGVVISTLHSIKGLEFDRVFIMDVNEGIIPYHKAVSENDREEKSGGCLWA